jgi:hypothetical protein
MQLTESERRLFLDLLDEEHSRDRRTHSIGRTTTEAFMEQSRLYYSLRAKPITHVPTPDLTA